MTIKRKNITVAGFVEVEADPADTVDTGGDSTLISSGAISAKFSGGGNMQAPSGKRVGTTQIKIVAGAEFLPVRVLESSDWASGANIVDGDVLTVSGTLSNVTLPTVMECIVDFGSIASRSISAKFNILQDGNLATSLFTRMTSRIFVSDTLTFGAETGSQSNNVQGTNTGAQNADFIQNEGPVSFRFVKFTIEQELTNVPSGQRPGICSVYEVNTPLETSTDAVVKLRASDTIDTADGTIIRDTINVSPNTTVVIDDDLLLIEALKFLTLDYATKGANDFNLNLSDITSITEV